MFDSIKKVFNDNRKWLVIFLCALPFFNDSYFFIQSFLDSFMDQAKVLIVLVLVFLTIRNRKKVSPLFAILVAMEGWWLISTLLNYPLKGNDYVYLKVFYDVMDVVAMGLIVEYFRDDPDNLTKGLMLNMELALYPNLISIFLKNVPGDRQYLIGFYAVHILWLMPAICISMLYMLRQKRYVRGLLLIGVSLLSVVMVKCATVIVAFLGMAGVIALGLITTRVFKLKKAKVLLSVFLCLAILLNLFVLFAYNGGSFPLIDIFFEKFLNRSTTFTGRVGIWEAAIEMIKDKPVIGHGFRPEVVRADGFRVIHAHNQLLQVLNARGIIGMVLFALFHVILCIKVDRSKNTFERLIMTGACFGIFLTYITEAYKKFFRFYLVFFLAYHIDELIRDKINNKDYLFK